MTQQGEKRWIETNRGPLIAAAALAVLFGIVLYRQREHKTHLNSRYQEVMHRRQEEVESNITFHQVTRLALYFAALGKTTKDHVDARITGSAGGPEHPRILRTRPSRAEMVHALGQPNSKEGEDLIWSTGNSRDMGAKLSAHFQKDLLASATFENGQYREHIGVKVAEWQWHGNR